MGGGGILFHIEAVTRRLLTVPLADAQLRPWGCPLWVHVHVGVCTGGTWRSLRVLGALGLKEALVVPNVLGGLSLPWFKGIEGVKWQGGPASHGVWDTGRE